MDFSLHAPINGLSLGQVSTSFLREFYLMGLEPCIFPIGNVDLSTQVIDKNFGSWLQDGIRKAVTAHKRKNPTFKIWHIQNSLESLSEKQVLMSFFELDSPTRSENNIIKQNYKVCFPSKYAKSVFEEFGATNIEYCPLGFDKYNFYKVDKKYFSDNRITFNLVGKLEKRKHHAKVIRAWISKFGKNPKYFLQAATFNPFLLTQGQNGQLVDHNPRLISEIIGGNKIFNVEFFNYFKSNSLYNDFLNSGDIVIGMSGGECFGLGEFQSVAMGKHAVMLKAHAYLDWADEENSIMINPSGKLEAFDEVFFKRGAEYNQGNIFDFDIDEFIYGCELAIKRVENNRLNEEGVKLQNQFTYKSSAEKIIQLLNN